MKLEIFGEQNENRFYLKKQKEMRINVTRQKMEERKSDSIESQYNKMTIKMLQLDSFGTFLLFHRRENSALQHSQVRR